MIHKNLLHVNNYLPNLPNILAYSPKTYKIVVGGQSTKGFICVSFRTVFHLSVAANKEGKMSVETIHHVQITIPKGAEAEARAFYRDFLGLSEVEKPDSLKGRGGFWLQIGAQQIHVGSEDGVNRAATKAHIAYTVTDVWGWQAKIAAYGLPIADSIPIPGYNRFEFRDPFGNRVEFIEAAF